MRHLLDPYEIVKKRHGKKCKDKSKSDNSINGRLEIRSKQVYKEIVYQKEDPEILEMLTVKHRNTSLISKDQPSPEPNELEIKRDRYQGLQRIYG